MKPALGPNALLSGAQAVVTAIVLFLTYRYLVRNLPPDDFGLWALLMSVAGVARLADFGVGAAVARFVAFDLGQEEPERAAAVIQTLVITIAALSGALCVGVWLALPLILVAVVPDAAADDAQRLLPYMLTNLALIMIGTATLGGLEGAQRFGLRALVVIAANLTFLAGCTMFVGSMGLTGVGVAQVLQGCVLVIGGWFSARAVLGLRVVLPIRFSMAQLQRVGTFGASFQLVAGFQILTEFLVKSLLTNRAGLSSAGLFEIAQRVVMQLRAPLVAACQILVPAVAGRAANNVGIVELYIRSCRLLGLASLAALGTLLVAWPLLTTVLMGRFDDELYALAVIVTIAWGINLLAVPAYLTLLGAGSTGWNVAGHGVTALATALAAVEGARSATTIVGIYGVALAAGSLIAVVGLHRRLRTRVLDCVPVGTGIAGPAVMLLAAAMAWVIPRLGLMGQWLATAAALVVLLLALLPVLRRLRGELPRLWPPRDTAG